MTYENIIKTNLQENFYEIISIFQFNFDNSKVVWHGEFSDGNKLRLD